MAKKRYRVGIDVGLRSVGLAAIEVNENDEPIRILKAQSVIHDGGVDPNSQKTGETRKLQAGVARRTRRMRRRRRARLERLDALLKSFGYPIVNVEDLHGFDMWSIRAHAADEYIEDDAERACAISIAARHIARHRGWRNPYHRTSSLLNVEAPSSEQYQQLRELAMATIGGEYIADGLTPAQVVQCVIDYHRGEPAVRIRPSRKKDNNRDGLINTRLMQEDNAYELAHILRMQRVDKDTADKLILAVFEQVSPKGSAEKNVGKDPLAPGKLRGLKASLAFQRYRLANVITNLRIREAGHERPLTVDEKNVVFDYLVAQSSGNGDVSWTDVCEELGIGRNDLKGMGTLTDDGEERISAKPPLLTSLQSIASLKDTKLKKRLMRWWNTQEEGAKESMLTLLSNTVDIDAKRDELDYAEAISFIEELDDDMLTSLDRIDLPSGRAAYSTDTLRALTERMLTTDDDLHEARKSLFHVTDSWRPPQPPIDAPLGNASVNRVVKIVNRFLLDAENAGAHR